MLQPIDQIQAIIGADFGGGFFGGSVSVDLKPYVIVIAPKGPGERVDLPLVNHPSSEAIALSPTDGLSNTQALATSGSQLSQWALDLDIGGFSDWYLPSIAELRILCANIDALNFLMHTPILDPSKAKDAGPLYHEFENLLFPDLNPEICKINAQLFQSGGSEAFETSSYWSSSLTKDGLVAIECFTSNGGYDSFGSGTEILSARAIRKVAI